MSARNRSRVVRGSVTILAALGAMGLTSRAHAGDWLVDGVIGVGSGMEGADTGNGAVEWQQARYRVSTGIDLTNEETPEQSFSVRGLAELQESALVGGELRYVRWIGKVVAAYASTTALVTPETLAGVGVGSMLNIPLGRLNIFGEGSLSALPLGSDRVNSGTVLWALLGIGIRVRL